MLEHEEFAQEGTIIRDILRAKRAAMPELTNQDIANMAGLSTAFPTVLNPAAPLPSGGCARPFTFPLISALESSRMRKRIPRRRKTLCSLKLRRFRKSAMGLSRS